MKKKGGATGVLQGFIDNNKGVLQPAYETTAAVGKAYSIFSALAGTLLALIFLALGIWLVRMHKDKTEEAQGTITKAECNSADRKCVATAEYSVGEKKYTVNFQSNSIVNEGQPVPIYYNPENPMDFIAETRNSAIGWIFILVAVVTIILVWAWMIFTLFFKPVAAATGVGAIVDAAIPE